MATIVVVEDEAPLRKSIAITLRRQGHLIVEVGTCKEARNYFASEDADLALVDLRLPDGDGMDLLAEARAGGEEIPVIVMTAYGTIDIAVEAMKRGAFDFLQKPFVPERLTASAARALEHRRLRAELLRRARSQAAEIIGSSPAMQKVKKLVVQAADAPVVLITGETGCGKDVVARAIQAVRGAEHPFVVVNCGALSPALVESELYGHVRGAFTGADTARRGLFGEADGGTAFLDEIGELPLPAQAGLLRFLEGGEYRPVGASELRRVSCQVVAATHRDLRAEVDAGRFREDLYFRLDRFRLHIPPLRDRPGDLGELVDHLVSRICERLGQQKPEIPEDTMAALLRHSWPGNVRELEHTLERAIVLCDGAAVSPELLFLSDDAAPEQAAEAGFESLAAVERRHILRVLEHVKQDRARAAAVLGISKSTLRRKLITYGMWEQRRPPTNQDE